jgi:hypothetical protein
MWWMVRILAIAHMDFFDLRRVEYTYCQTLGGDEAYRRLREHWDTWIVEDDFRLMAQYGTPHTELFQR